MIVTSSSLFEFSFHFAWIAIKFIRWNFSNRPHPASCWDLHLSKQCAKCLSLAHFLHRFFITRHLFKGVGLNLAPNRKHFLRAFLCPVIALRGSLLIRWASALFIAFISYRRNSSSNTMRITARVQVVLLAGYLTALVQSYFVCSEELYCRLKVCFVFQSRVVLSNRSMYSRIA